MARLKIQLALHKGNGNISLRTFVDDREEGFSLGGGRGKIDQSIEFPEIEVSDEVLAPYRSPHQGFKEYDGLRPSGAIRKYLNAIYGPYVDQHTHNKVNIRKSEKEWFLTPVTVFQEACDIALWVNAIRARPSKSVKPSLNREAKTADPEAKTALPALAIPALPQTLALLTPQERHLNIQHYLNQRHASNQTRRRLKPIGRLFLLALTGLIIYLTGGLGLLGLPLFAEILAVTGILGTGAQGMTLLHSTTMLRKVLISSAIIVSAVVAGVLIGLSSGGLALIIAGGITAAVASGYFAGFFAWLKSVCQKPQFDPHALPFEELLLEDEIHAEAKIEPAPAPEKTMGYTEALDLQAQKVVPAKPLQEYKRAELKLPAVEVPAIEFSCQRRSWNRQSKAPAFAPVVEEVKSAAPAEPLQPHLIMLDIDENLITKSGKWTAPWPKILAFIEEEFSKRGKKAHFVCISFRDTPYYGFSPEIGMITDGLRDFIKSEDFIYTRQRPKSIPLARRVEELGIKSPGHVFCFDDQEQVMTDVRAKGYMGIQTPYLVGNCPSEQGHWEKWFRETVFPQLGIPFSYKAAHKLGMTLTPEETAQEKADQQQVINDYHQLYIQYAQLHGRYQTELGRFLKDVSDNIRRLTTKIQSLQAERDRLLIENTIKSVSHARVLEVQIVQYMVLKRQRETLQDKIQQNQYEHQHNLLPKLGENYAFVAFEREKKNLQEHHIPVLQKALQEVPGEFEGICDALAQQEGRLQTQDQNYTQAQASYQQVLTEAKACLDSHHQGLLAKIDDLEQNNAPQSAITVFKNLAQEIQSINLEEYDPSRAEAASEKLPAGEGASVDQETTRINDATRRFQGIVTQVNSRVAVYCEEVDTYQRRLRSDYDALFPRYQALFRAKLDPLIHKIQALEARLAALGQNVPALQRDAIGFGKWQVFFPLLEEYRTLQREIQRAIDHVHDFDVLRRHPETIQIGKISNPREAEIERLGQATQALMQALNDKAGRFDERIKAVDQQLETIPGQASTILAERRGILAGYCRYSVMPCKQSLTASQALAEHLSQSVAPGAMPG